MKKFLFVFILLLFNSVFSQTETYLSGIPFSIDLSSVSSSDTSKVLDLVVYNKSVDKKYSVQVNRKNHKIVIRNSGLYEILYRNKQLLSVRIIPAWFSILPPLLAILLALVFRQVLLALFSGIYLGMFFLYDFNPILAFFKIGDTLIVNILSDKDHVLIILFTLIIGGLVGIISANGGTKGLAEVIVKRANSPEKGMFASWLLGIAIFFDDYSNSLLVGNMMRPITDKLRVSREKLAYIVDSTAAPVTSLVVVSTWIGYELGLIGESLKSIGSSLSAYEVFIKSIVYRFYPIVAIVFVLMIILSKRDFGPMYKAEINARKFGIKSEDNFQGKDGNNQVVSLWYNAVIPILILLIATFAGLIITGKQSLENSGITTYGVSEIIGASNSYYALLWGSMLATAVAIFLSLATRTLRINKIFDAFVKGMSSLFVAVVILSLAWGIGKITSEVHTADYLISILVGNVNIKFLASLVFLVCALTSFATGTSWGTMAIVMPIVIPLTVDLSNVAGLSITETEFYLVSTVASVLAGSVFGDHCSPIADTTILSSLASSCDHVAHVRTQLPYALTAGIASFIFGSLFTAFGVPVLIAYLLIFASLYGVIKIFGKSISVN